MQTHIKTATTIAALNSFTYEHTFSQCIFVSGSFVGCFLMIVISVFNDDVVVVVAVVEISF